jgi:hypothetical protein
VNGVDETDDRAPDLSIVIVSWNVADLLMACLASIFATTGELVVEVIVVDSASSDGSVERVRSDYPQVALLAQDSNVGFTRGNNIGLKVARGRHILLLNPDTEVRESALERMVSYLDETPDVGVVGPYTHNTDGSHQSTRRRFPTVPLAFFESTWLQGMAPRGWLDRFYVRDQPDDATCDVDWVQGSAMMLRRAVYKQIGGLDEGFVMFSEEMDWCRRARDAGWRVVYVGDAHIVHHGGKSTEQASANKHIYFQESKLRYFRKHHGVIVALTLRVFLLLSYACQIGLEGVKSLLGSKRDMRQERMRMYWQVLRSGLKVH